MLNNKPIFLNCFSRGGSNILWNMFLSHPDVCSPMKETLEIFRFDRQRMTRAGWRVIWYGGQWNLFDQWYLRPRRPVSVKTEQFVDHTLALWKEKTFTDAEMRYKTEDEIYTLEEVTQARLAAKNNNGLAFLSDMFYQMYPEATFIALIRDPIPLYESYKRRGISKSPTHFMRFYATLVERMMADSERLPNYHLVRFEDLLTQPYQMVVQLYQWATLDLSKLKKVRLKAKSHLQSDGQHKSNFQEGQHYWFEPDQLHNILEPEINRYQVDHLLPDEKEQLLSGLGRLREQLGYQ